jgi:putative membrane protein
MSEATPASPYSGHGQQLILRDVLAIDRTRLANERTLLSWLRTALMLLVSGVTLLKLFEGVAVMEVTGALLIPASFVTAGLGVRRYLRSRTLIEAADKDEQGSASDQRDRDP